MRHFISRLVTAGQWLKAHGAGALIRRLAHHLLEKLESRKVQKWLRIHGTLTHNERVSILRQIGKLPNQPLISVLTPVYNVDEKWLRLAIESVRKQLYTNWELCIADDCSPSPHVKRILREYAEKDSRVKIVYRYANGHISAASNSALEIATGEFIGLLDHDDELAEDALFQVAKEINDFPAADMIYSDEDMIDENGRRYSLKFKPDWSRDLFYSVNYVTHFAVYRTVILRKIGGFREGFEGSQDYDLALRVIEQIPENHIRHIPRILYHWRAVRGSVALDSSEKPYAHDRARNALRSHFERCGVDARVEQGVNDLHRVRYDLPDPLPKVSLILLSYNGDKRGLIDQTDYDNLEVIRVSKNGSEAETLNTGVSKSTGEILCFIDGNLLPLSRDWLTELASFAAQERIGAAGARILNPDNSVSGGGLILGGKNLVNNAYQDSPAGVVGIIGRNSVIGNFSAVSVSCMAIRRELFDAVGGFDSVNLPNRFYDADFCLRLAEKGYRMVFTPYAELIKTGRKVELNMDQKPTRQEARYFAERWSEVIGRDPFYNPNLSDRDGRFSIGI